MNIFLLLGLILKPVEKIYETAAYKLLAAIVVVSILVVLYGIFGDGIQDFITAYFI